MMWKSVFVSYVSSYLDALRKIFVIEDMPAWNPNLHFVSARSSAP